VNDDASDDVGNYVGASDYVGVSDDVNNDASDYVGANDEWWWCP
jgi:hypothetical protein